jgi:coenzyme F420-0:L-glutamate ligase / coenzyme F420-1:gamma-L-glutamate ligase
MALILNPLTGIPLIKNGDDIPIILLKSIHENSIDLQDGDILVVTHKIVSKAEGRQVQLSDVHVSERAMQVAEISDKNPKLIELILSESKELLRVTRDHIIVEHRLGFICANAGIDHSNVSSSDGNSDDSYVLLPLDPDRTASLIKREIEKQTGKRIGVLIIDSHGRAWRNGIVGATIGLAGMPALVDLRGKEDIFGFKLRITQVAAADELAAAASLMMGQADEKIPVVHVRGFPYCLRDSSMRELIRDKEKDLFR